MYAEAMDVQAFVDLHGGFSVGHWIKSYSCFHLLSKTIKTVEEEETNNFSLIDM